MAEKGSGKLLSVSDWEQLLQDFRYSHELQQKWLTSWPGLTIMDQALQLITKKEFSLQGQLFDFLEENGKVLIGEDTVAGVSMLVESLKDVLQAPVDGSLVTQMLKEQMMVMVTTIAITVDAIHTATSHLETLTEILLAFISRTNYAVDRQVRATACECLKELEMAHPCLLHVCVGHVYSLCQSERTHAGQAYKLLLTAILHNMACHMYTVKSRSTGAHPFLSVIVPLVPFSIPSFLATYKPGEGPISVPAKELTAGCLKEFKRAVAYLLQRLELLTEFGMLEFVAKFINIARALELHGSLLKTQFSILLYTFNPVLIHVVLLIFSQFLEACEGDETAVLNRLVYVSRESQQFLPVRLLGVQWLLAVANLLRSRYSVITPLATSLYPLVYDPLSLKLSKLGALAHCAAILASSSSSESSASHQMLPPSPTARSKTALAPRKRQVGIYNVLSMGDSPTDPASKLLNEGLFCLSSFTWLPPSSTETHLTFQVLHKFLTAGIPHQRCLSPSNAITFTNSSLFISIQLTLVRIALKLHNLIPSIIALLDRLIACDAHKSLGECLLRTFNEELLSQLAPSRKLPAYFPLLERITEASDISPGGTLELLTLYIRKRVEEDKDDGGSKLWLHGSQQLQVPMRSGLIALVDVQFGRINDVAGHFPVKFRLCCQVLGICRTLLMHHKSSRGFQQLSHLLTFFCRFFPDIEVRDTSRLYLRMLISIPGNLLHDILSYGDERIEETNAPPFNNDSSLLSDPRKLSPMQVGAYIRLTRKNMSLVRHTWSLVLYNTFWTGIDGGYKDLSHGGRYVEVVVEEVSDQPKEGSDGPKDKTDQERSGDKGAIVVKDQMSGRRERRTETLPRVMDARTSEILGILRQHFEEILDFRISSGVKISVRCNLRFQGEVQQRMQAEAEGVPDTNDSASWPAIYAVVISFITTGLYGPIPSVHVPFLLSEPPQRKIWKLPGAESPTSVFTEDGLRTGRGDTKGKAFESDENSSSRELTVELTKDDELLYDVTVIVELEPKQPVPTLVDAQIVFSDEDGHSVHGQLDSIPVGIEDLFLKPPLPPSLHSTSSQSEYYYTLFKALFDACAGPGTLGPETFSLKNSGTRAGVSIEGSESVKLLEGQADRIIGAVEQWLAPFVVAVSGTSLVTMAKVGGLLSHAVFLEDDFTRGESSGLASRSRGRSSNRDEGSALWLDSPGGKGETGNVGVRVTGLEEGTKGGLGSFHVLIFLPPRYHLLLKMEVSDWSTLVRIRTDNWPCLAHIDEFLEALVTSR